jgi:hypothetical protein
MWNSIHKFGLSDEDIETIKEQLWQNEEKKTCPDCGVISGAIHLVNCDVARCPECEGQMLSCSCKEWRDSVWEGRWPGAEDCYKEGLVCCWEDTKEWAWDLNELGRRKL